MTAPRLQRMTAEIEGEFVVFTIGMRINCPWKAHRWVPVFRAVGKAAMFGPVAGRSETVGGRMVPRQEA